MNMPNNKLTGSIVKLDFIERLNSTSEYIEKNLHGELSMEELARIALCTPDSFSRFFSYMTGMTPSEYIRRRKLTLAAYELRDTNIKVIDAAIKYGWNSTDAFTRAFARQHGVTPTQARIPSCKLKVYPPVSFHIIIKGAEEMEFKIVTLGELRLHGLSKAFTGEASERFEQEHTMWGASHDCDDITSRISTSIPGTWYGIWNGSKYSVARKKEDVNFGNLEEIIMPEGEYAIFYTDNGGFAGDELPRLRGQIFDSWLKDSGYTQSGDYEVEVYHLYPKTEKHLRHYEIWIPVQKVR